MLFYICNTTLKQEDVWRSCFSLLFVDIDGSPIRLALLLDFSVALSEVHVMRNAGMNGVASVEVSCPIKPITACQ